MVVVVGVCEMGGCAMTYIYGVKGQYMESILSIHLYKDSRDQIEGVRFLASIFTH